MQLSVIKSNKKAAESIEVLDTVFAQEFNEPLVHQVIVAYDAGARSGTRGQLSRCEVRGGGAKPWKQKGTGRARAGSNTSPIWVGGGRAFAAKSQDHSQKVNKKMHRGAMRSILSELNRQNRLIIVENFEMMEPKTKDLASKLKSLDLQEVLIVIEQENKNLSLAVRNLPRVALMRGPFVDPVSLVQFDKILMTVAALRQIEEVLK